MIKAMFFDLDGTLLDASSQVSEGNRAALEAARKEGLLLGLSTGRDVNSVREQLKKDWQLDGLIDLVVGSGGAEVYDARKDTIREYHFLEGALIQEVMAHFADMDVNFAIPWQGELVAPRDDAHIQMLSEADRVPYRVEDFDEFLQTPKPKVMIVCAPETMPAVVERAQSFESDRYKSAALQTASILYEYMDPTISKPEGIRHAVEEDDIEMEEIATFGDADNDWEMTACAGFGIAMGNGSEKTKSVADLITADHVHDGVAEGIYAVLRRNQEERENG